MTTTRFAPSPTGFLHVGNARTALLNWLFARKRGGRFILRLDDTDASRSEERFADAIRRDLAWLGLQWDAEERQSDRLGTYVEAAERLRGAGRLYECFETAEELALRRKVQLAAHRPPVYDRAALKLSEAEKARLREERPSHWRFLLDAAPVEWTDVIRGVERMDPASLSDPVLVREDGQFLYTLASVVDDIAMGVTHVIRGADHVTNTGVQAQIFAALGGAVPEFAHHSLLTAPGGAALSKREGALSLGELREAGVEPLAVCAFLARLGTSGPVEPVTTMEELVEGFDLGGFGAAPTAFDPAELTAFSAKVLRGLPVGAVAPRLAALGIPEGVMAPLWDAVAPNLARLEEAAEWWEICRDGVPPVTEDAEFVGEALGLLPPRPWGPESWKVWTSAVQQATGRKGRALFQPLRRALTGRDHGPDMAALMPLLQRPA